MTALGVLVVLYAAGCLHVSDAATSGEFTAVLDSLDNSPEESREFADWHFYLKRYNKTVKVMDGYYEVKKDIVRPSVEIETYLKTKNKFVKIDTNRPKKIPCESLTLFFDAYMEGNATWTEDCVFKPGYLTIRKDKPFNPDEIAHMLYTKAFYRTFKFILKADTEDGQVALKLSFVVTIKRKE